MPKPQASQDLPRLANPCLHTAGTPFLTDGWMDGIHPLAGQLKPPSVWLMQVSSLARRASLPPVLGLLLPPPRKPGPFEAGVSHLLLPEVYLFHRVTPETLISHNILLLEGLTKLCYPGLASNFGTKPSPPSQPSKYLELWHTAPYLTLYFTLWFL